MTDQRYEIMLKDLDCCQNCIHFTLGIHFDGCGEGWCHCGEWTIHPRADVCDKYKSAADEIRMTLPENIWRNAEQDPPEENTPVLCYAVSTAGEGHFKVIGVLRNKEFWFLQVNDARWSSFPNMQLRVTHWQPLPEDPTD